MVGTSPLGSAVWKTHLQLVSQGSGKLGSLEDCDLALSLANSGNI